MTDAPAPRLSPRARRERARKAHAERQKLLRAKRKLRFEEILALLERIPDDAPIIVTELLRNRDQQGEQR